MFGKISVTILLVVAVSAQGQNQCKNPFVAKRLLSDDVRFASPFYVIALPRNPETSKVDNVCYTYFETGKEGFNHFMSITYQDGSNKYHTYTKGDISNQMGLAEGKAGDGSSCTYHDYTLVPICNSTVFILYRCYIGGECNDIDIGPNPKIDSRIVLAATPVVSQECYTEVDKSMKNTTFFKGGDYVILPNKLPPQCVTKYNGVDSIGSTRAVGSKVVSEDVGVKNRFDDDDTVSAVKSTQKPTVQTAKPTQATWPSQNAPAANQGAPKIPYNPAGSGFQSSMSAPGRNPAANQGAPKVPYNPAVSGFQSSMSASGFSNSYAFSHTSSGNNHGYMPEPAWGQNEWSTGPNPNPWLQTGHTGDTHYHSWQAHGNGHHPAQLAAKPDAWNNPPHVNMWGNPPPGGCCKCNN